MPTGWTRYRPRIRLRAMRLRKAARGAYLRDYVAFGFADRP
ncbi:hypothetical protein [uncultured Paracoccus sp.]|nr:hypothetical protein [uncultured Paracoccus sp.]